MTQCHRATWGSVCPPPLPHIAPPSPPHTNLIEDEHQALPAPSSAHGRFQLWATTTLRVPGVQHLQHHISSLQHLPPKKTIQHKDTPQKSHSFLTPPPPTKTHHSPYAAPARTAAATPLPAHPPGSPLPPSTKTQHYQSKGGVPQWGGWGGKQPQTHFLLKIPLPPQSVLLQPPQAAPLPHRRLPRRVPPPLRLSCLHGGGGGKKCILLRSITPKPIVFFSFFLFSPPSSVTLFCLFSFCCSTWAAKRPNCGTPGSFFPAAFTALPCKVPWAQMGGGGGAIPVLGINLGGGPPQIPQF